MVSNDDFVPAKKTEGIGADVFYAIKHDLSLLIDQKGQ